MICLGPIFLLLTTTVLANPINNITADEEVGDDYDGYRLPGTQVPIEYKLDLIASQEIFDNKINTFEGQVAITFYVTEKTKSIQLHAPMKINSVSLKISDGADVNIIDFDKLNTTTSILTINLDSELETKINYILSISYTGDIDLKTMYGWYKSSYTNENNETEYLLATQFEPVSARQAFPCFDEPKLKAYFTLSITYPKGYNALGNTPQDGEPESTGTDQFKVVFKRTPKISTYLVAFIVSKFTCSDGESIADNVPARVCSRDGAKNTRTLAVEYGTKILKELQSYFNIEYKENMDKMDQIAIPDFGAGAMENWGLVTYRERALLYDADETSDYYKQSVITVIAHEFTHQWFGDLVTCNWWDDIFLNEGFAAYFQYFILTQLDELSNWEFDKQFNVLVQQSVLVDDGAVSSKAITSKAATPSEIHAKFGSIVYNKGSSIIRMMENIMESKNFKTGLQNYLKTKSLSAAVPSDLLNTLGEVTGTLPNGKSFTETMENWINKPGYPVLSPIKRGLGITIKQQRFLYDGDDETSLWNIPITVTGSSDENKFESIQPKYWLTKSTDSISNVFQESDTWFILNNQQSAYYRVQYDDSNWQEIAKQLLANHSVIHVLNRAQIADDLFNFARAGFKTNYSEAFILLDYLKQETDYYPWVPVLNSMNYLLTRVGEDTTLGARLKVKVLDMLDGIYKTLSFEIEEEDLPIPSLTRDLIFNAACKYGSYDCYQNAKTLFENYTAEQSIHKNLKKVVYCNGLKQSTDEQNDWNFLWNKYQSTQLSSEQVTILGALSCVKNKNILKNYLDLSVNETSGIRIQDLAAVWTSVYTSTPEGIQASLEYLIDHHQALLDYYSDAPTLINGIASQFTNQEQIDQLQKFIDSTGDLSDAYKIAAKDAIENAENNLKWMENVRDDLENYLPPAPIIAGVSKIGSVSSLVLVLITVFKLLMVY